MEPDQLREAFEAYMLKLNCTTNLSRIAFGEQQYKTMTVRNAWGVWCAALDAQRKESKE